MKLNSGQLPWGSSFPNPPSYPALEGDITCDCLIVGGGMGGAMSSYRLSLSGADIVLIDKRAIGGGSSHANTVLAADSQ